MAPPGSAARRGAFAPATSACRVSCAVTRILSASNVCFYGPKFFPQRKGRGSGGSRRVTQRKSVSPSRTHAVHARRAQSGADTLLSPLGHWATRLMLTFITGSALKWSHVADDVRGALSEKERLLVTHVSTCSEGCPGRTRHGPPGGPTPGPPPGAGCWARPP